MSFPRKLNRPHRYRPEIPEPAPSLSRHGAPIGSIWVFPATVIRHVRMYAF